MEKFLLKKLNIPDIVHIISNYVYNPINRDVCNQIRNFEYKQKFYECGEIECKCNQFYQSQFELRMRRTNQYCFGCPNSNLQQSEYEQECPVCGLTTY